VVSNSLRLRRFRPWSTSTGTTGAGAGRSVADAAVPA